MKRLFPALLFSLCLLALCACGQDALPAVTTAEVIATEETTTAIPSTTQAPTMPPIEYPASYKDAPEAYKPVLDELYKFVYILVNDIRPIDENELFGKSGGIADTPGSVFSYGGFQSGYVGYAIKDINGDGTPELILLNKESTILSLFTLKDNKPVLLGSYSRREYCGGIAADGTIYTVGRAGAAAYSLTASNQKPGASELTELTYFYCDADYNAEPTAFFYRQVINGEERDITHERFQELMSQYSTPPTPMQFTFIPIEQ